MTTLTAPDAYRRFLILTCLRWLPVGLLIPILVLLPLDRGLGIAEIGLAFSIQGFVVLGLELPTGGLADAIGRRRVLLASTLLSFVSVALLTIADSFAELAAVAALQGIYRALDSGPLEAWFVDASLVADADAPIDRAMSAHGTVLGLSIAAGSIASGGLVAIEPVPDVNPLVVPVIVSLVFQVIGAAALAVLMIENRPAAGHTLWASVRATPRTVVDGLRLLRGSHVLLALVCVELFWGFGMATFESLLPVRLAEVAGGTEVAAAITGPAASVAWLAHAVGAAGTARLGRRIGVAAVGALTRVAQGLFVVCLGLLGGVAGVLTASVGCYIIHGSSNAAHATLLHRQATEDVRATVVSLNSMASQPAGAIGLIILSAIADTSSVSTAMYVGGAVLAVAAPLYLPAWRQERAAAATPTPATAVS